MSVVDLTLLFSTLLPPVPDAGNRLAWWVALGGPAPKLHHLNWRENAQIRQPLCFGCILTLQDEHLNDKDMSVSTRTVSSPYDKDQSKRKSPNT